MSIYETKRLQNVYYECSLDKKLLQGTLEMEQAKLAEINRLNELYLELYQNLSSSLTQMDESYGKYTKVYSTSIGDLHIRLFNDNMFRIFSVFSEARRVYQSKINVLVDDSDFLQRKMNGLAFDIEKSRRNT